MNLLKQKWNNKSLWNPNQKKKKRKKTSAYRVSVQQFLQKFFQRPHTGKWLQDMENYQRVQQSHSLFMMRFSTLKTWVLGRIVLICHNPFLNRSAARSLQSEFSTNVTSLYLYFFNELLLGLHFFNKWKQSGKYKQVFTSFLQIIIPSVTY